MPSDLFKVILLGLVVLGLGVFVLWTMPTRWIEANDGDFQQAFLSHVARQTEWEMSVKEVFSRILTAWWEKQCGGVILKGPSTTTTTTTTNKDHYQAIEFVSGPRGPSKIDGIPMIQAKWPGVTTTDETLAKSFVKRFPRVEIISCPDQDTFDAFVKHLASCHRSGQAMDAITVGPVVEGYISPVKRQ